MANIPNGYLMQTAMARRKYIAEAAQNTSDQKSGKESNCVCIHAGWMSIQIYKDIASGVFSYTAWGKEKMSCATDSYPASWSNGEWGVQGEHAGFGGAEQTDVVTLDLWFSKECNECTRRPCNVFQEWFIPRAGGTITGSGKYNSMPDWAKLLYEAGEDLKFTNTEKDNIIISWLDWMDSTSSWPGGKDPQKKTCREVEPWCKRGGGDPFN